MAARYARLVVSERFSDMPAGRAEIPVRSPLPRTGRSSRPGAMRERRASELPDWAVWSLVAAARPWTVGIEEEVMLLDRRDWSLANRIGDVLGALPAAMASRTSAETHACVVELRTAPFATVAEAAADLASLRHGLNRVVRGLGLRAAVAGTHPLATCSEVAVSPGGRHREVEATMRVLARREPTMALHVHVAVPDAGAAVRALDGLRDDLPLLLALSANSPFWRASDSGFASIRTPIFSMFPRVGIPRHFGAYAEYVHAVEALLVSKAIPEPGFLWWDARLRPQLGTVEVRIMDSQSRVADVAAIAAVVQCLVRRHASSRSMQVAGPEALSENRFLAARDGMRAQLIQERTGGRRAVRDALSELLDDCRPHADALGCLSELAGAASIADDPGDARQRRLAARDGLAAVPARLGEHFISADSVVAAA